jgi:ATP-dependent DNA helicase DinG
MLIKLRQGVGRLIRSETDTGIVAILDSRLSSRSNALYRSDVISSLPIKNITENINDVKCFAKKKILASKPASKVVAK